MASLGTGILKSYMLSIPVEDKLPFITTNVIPY